MNVEPLSPGWHAALAEAWEAYLRGSYPIGACVVDANGQVIARGRNRLGEPRNVEGGFIAGHDLAHAEINALLNLTDTPSPECHGWTVLTTVEPCPQCAGAILMSGVRGVDYAAPDPWAGSKRLLTDDPYAVAKGMRVGRAPENVQRLALRLVLTGFLEDGLDRMGPFLKTFDGYRADVEFAADLHKSGALAALRDREASLDEALELLA
ncbi:nucleoside deaminase [Deinococcus arenicola]|uniref:Nucleoside deaminase n=1 Tax=Deinococcus arenicola TaxID=2994950 RepID=A0ABU4DKT7_9DEIO|nr:nucleoside deaminase [Deinococcus sp. ZS9-10]MDV6373043.1 nucleoside deaminase [Deinococcus sp. ZS9-10]